MLGRKTYFRWYLQFESDKQAREKNNEKKKRNTSGKIQKFIHKQKYENSNEFSFPEIRKKKYPFDFMRILSDEEENELKTIL